MQNMDFWHYINGELVRGEGDLLEVRNPATEEITGRVIGVSAAQTEAVLESAQTAYEQWSKVSPQERAGWLLRLRDECINNKDILAELISEESGKPYESACQDFDWCMNSFSYYAEEGKRIYGITIPNPSGFYGSAYHMVDRRPIGVVVGYLAWNYPLGNAGLKIGPAIVSGCPCIIKPSSQTPLSALYLGKLACEIGLPRGVLNVIAGSSDVIGKVLNASPIPRMITLIGSRETGLRIMKEGAGTIRKYSFELGGNAPVIIMDDVDVKQVAATIVLKKTGNAGQTCVNYNRIYVHEKIYSELIQEIMHELDRVVLGKGHDLGCVMGPLINRQARDRMIDLIRDAMDHGAELMKGGEIPEAFSVGCYITPALLVNVTEKMRVSREEIFGPIIPLQSFSRLEEVLEKANRTIYGLSAYYFGHDARQISKVIENLQAGEIFINGCPAIQEAPHAGMKQSGIGCDRSRWSLEEYFDFKYIAMIP